MRIDRKANVPEIRVFHVACAYLFYQLFKPVNRHLSFFAMLVLLIATAVQALYGRSLSRSEPRPGYWQVVERVQH